MTWSEAAFAVALAVLTVGGLLIRRAVMGLNQRSTQNKQRPPGTERITVHSQVEPPVPPPLPRSGADAPK
ncbi:MAG: hypothetical protein AABZ53_13235 [Planctomycetota bacterium]